MRILAGLALLVLLTVPGRAAGEPEPESTLVSGGGDSRSFFFEAGPGGAVYRLRGGAELFVSAGARMRRFPGMSLLHLGGAKPTPTHVVVVRSGQVSVSVPEGASHAVLLKGSRGVSIISVHGRATAVVAPGAVAVANHEGVARATLGSFWEVLPPGHQRVLDERDRVGAAKPTIAPPVVAPGERVFDALDGTGTVRGLTWTAVPGASGYRVVLERADGSVLDSTETRSPNLDHPLGPVEPGRHLVRLRSIDSRGIEGLASEATPVFVVGVSLQAGAYIDDAGEVNLARGQIATLVGADGLDMTYAGSSDWIRAPRGVGLFRGEPTTIHLRAPGTPTFLAVRLVPRDLHADVYVGPKKLLWPSAPARVTVRVSTRSGEPLPSGVDVVPRVRLGLAPLDVTWAREGNVLTASVPPQEGPGPWVLRVNVEDQHGLPLGRDFLEIERAAPAKPRAGARSKVGRALRGTSVE